MTTDKGHVKFAPETAPLEPRWNLVFDLRGSMRRMMARGHRPGSFLVARLTDGRIKLSRLNGRAEDAEARLAQLRNEYGPVHLAVVVKVLFSKGKWDIRVEEPGAPARQSDSPRRAVLLRGVPALG